MKEHLSLLTEKSNISQIPVAQIPWVLLLGREMKKNDPIVQL